MKFELNENAFDDFYAAKWYEKEQQKRHQQHEQNKYIEVGDIIIDEYGNRFISVENSDVYNGRVKVVRRDGERPIYINRLQISEVQKG